ncbi:MAG: hypothetical protein ACOCUT_03420 [bacterium]
MWVKSFKIISSILEDLDKNDGKFHDIQIVNDAIYIDGEKMVDISGSAIWCDKALNTKTLNFIFERGNKMPYLDNDDLVVELSMHGTKYMTVIKSIKNEEVFYGLSDESYQQAVIKAIKKLYRELEEERNTREKILDRLEDVLNGK